MKTVNWTGLPTLALLILVQGCTLMPQKLHLDPVIDVSGPPVTTTDTLIGLSVADSRSTTKLGEVGDPNKEMVPVTLDGDFTARLNQRLTKALEKRGFSVVPDSGAMTRSIAVYINSLVLNSEKRPLDFETELKAQVSAVARNSNEKYDRAYYVRTHKVTAGPPYEKHSNQLVNDAVSQALSDMLNDDRLFEMLAR
jgi:uncharacterized lipoprotein YajG